VHEHCNLWSNYQGERTGKKDNAMRLIDHSQYQSRDGKIGLWNRLQGTLQFGPAWYRDMLAQQEVVEQFRLLLDHRYIMLRNIILPGSGVPIPLILVGPTGICVLLVSSLRGVYRARESEWLVMDGGRFKAAKPNLLARIQLMVRVIDAHLRRDGLTPPDMQSALLFTNPGQHVDTVNPSVRVVLSDAMDRFVAGIAQDSGVFRMTDVEAIVKSLAPQADLSDGQAAAAGEEDDDFFSLRDERKGGRAGMGSGSAGIPGIEVVDSIANKARFSTGQWVALGLVIGVFVLLLFAFLLMVMFL
jgi:hypothetical protein